LAVALAEVTGRLNPDEAAKLCRPTATRFAQALAKPPHDHRTAEWAESLAAVAGRLPPDEAAGLCRPVAQVLLDSLDKPLNPGNWDGWRTASVGLVAVAARLPADEATRLLSAALGKTNNPGVQRALAEGVAAVALRVGPDESVGLCGAFAGRLADAVAGVTSPSDLAVLGDGVSIVAARLPTDRAAEVCRPVAKTLAAALARIASDENNNSEVVAKALVTVATRLPPTEATAVLAAAAAGITEAAALRALAEGLAALDAPTDPAPLARAFLDATGVAGPSAWRPLAEGWSLVLLGVPPRDRVRPKVLAPLGTLATPHQLLPTLPLHRHRPRPRPLPPQALIDLLKHPFCVGEFRRVVLDALELAYDRPFADVWGFVEFARERYPHLDLHTPPGRPGPKS
jgi:hypothetical protein